MTRSELGRIGPHLVALVHERPGGVATTVWDSMKMGELRSMVRVGGTPTFMLKLRLDLTPAWAAPSCFLVLESSRENNQIGKRKSEDTRDCSIAAGVEPAWTCARTLSRRVP